MRLIPSFVDVERLSFLLFFAREKCCLFNLVSIAFFDRMIVVVTNNGDLFENFEMCSFYSNY